MVRFGSSAGKFLGIRVSLGTIDEMLHTGEGTRGESALHVLLITFTHCDVRKKL
jgi:hypothetical protein